MIDAEQDWENNKLMTVAKWIFFVGVSVSFVGLVIFIASR